MDPPWGDMGHGMLTTHRERLMYAPTYFPVIVQYKPDGSIAYARATPDWGHVDPPKWEVANLRGMRASRIKGQRLHSDLSVYGGRLFVQANLNSGWALDVYDVPTGDYEYSISRVTVYDIIEQQ